MSKLSYLAKNFKDPPQKYQPYVRWWWFGSAVTKDELKRELEMMHDKKIGGVEIQPIYSALPGHPIEGLKDIDWLSPEWLDMVAYTVETARDLGMTVDLTFGSGWPFGGPFITKEHASKKISRFSSKLESGESLEIPLEDLADEPKKLVSVHAVEFVAYQTISPDIVNLLNFVDENDIIKWDVPEGDWALVWYLIDLTRQKVKRAGPGGEGYVLDHLDRKAFKFYADALGKALKSRFGKDLGKWFGAFFCDSWEVYGENWTTGFLEGFKKEMGYDLRPYMPFLPFDNDPKYYIDRSELEEGWDINKRIVYDYKKYHADLILNEFFQQFANWCREAGVKCRVQPYSAPTDLLRAYGMLDILEIEGFKDQGIRTDYYKNVDPGFPSSAAHLYGKDLVSCESFTWFGEHFSVSLEKLKEESEEIILSGVNRIIYHGYPYSPPEAGHPGWNFYASISANHNNTWWPYFGLLNEYIARNSFLSTQGKGVTDFAVYLPYHDKWSGYDGIIKDMNESLSLSIKQSDFDYINDECLLNAATFEKGKLHVGESEYYALVLYSVSRMPLNTARKIKELVLAGMPLLVMYEQPMKAPGLPALTNEESLEVKKVFSELIECNAFFMDEWFDIDEWLDIRGLVPDFHSELETGGSCVGFLHKKMDDLDLYFIKNHAWETRTSTIYLRAQGNVELWNSMTGTRTPVKTFKDDYNRTVLKLTLKANETAWLVVSENLPEVDNDVKSGDLELDHELNLEYGWKVEFECPKNVFPEEERRAFTKEKDYLFDWQNDRDTLAFSGTAIYRRTLNIGENSLGEFKSVILDLGEVHEIAEVIVNGENLGVLWHGAREVDIKDAIREGENQVEIKVTNLLLNKVIGYGRNGVKWKPDYYFVNMNYEDFDAKHMLRLKSGILGPILVKFFK